MLRISILNQNKAVLLAGCYRPLTQSADVRKDSQSFEFSLEVVISENPDAINVMGNFNDRLHTGSLSS